ncbi:MAG: DinB family protein [Hyphomicrobiaceae bacterium]|nr:DinB family protein [Hyphomicrobiaceae bacterium]
MISNEYVRTMARYNEWQNRSLYTAAGTLSDADRRHDRGAFFGSIHGTLSHLLWADEQWMSRFTAAVSKPTGSGKESPDYCRDWDELQRRRNALDGQIIGWADAMDASGVYGDLTWYSGLAKAERSMARWKLFAHFFNHQTHHRGQVHAMLTAAGARPDDTDLMIMKT